MMGKGRMVVLGIGLTVGIVAALVWWRFETDIGAARDKVFQGSTVIDTPCGAIEYQEAGTGLPLLAIHGSGGGYDQGMAFAAPLTLRGFRVIAMSRFGYLRTPMPVGSTADAQAQAKAHVCLLDRLGIEKAALLGYSAGAPSAVQMAINHPDRVSALVLLSPIVFQPHVEARTSEPLPRWLETTFVPDFLLWSGLHVARNEVIKAALGTPPELLATAGTIERARINEILGDMLPVDTRAAGSRNDSAIMSHLVPLPIQSIRAPTLVVSSRDDGYGTYASAEYTAQEITGAKFLGFETGGHTWVGHNDAVIDAILELIIPPVAASEP